MEPEKKRRRPAVSCILCRKRKIRCDRKVPCSNCVRSKNAACIYENLSATQNVQQRGLDNDGASSISTVSTPPVSSSVESMRSRIRHLEEQIHALTRQANQSASIPISTFAVPRIGDTQHKSTSNQPFTQHIPSREKVTDSRSPSTFVRGTVEAVPFPADTNDAALPPSSTPKTEWATSELGGTFYIHHGNPALGQPPGINRSVTHKKRMFGQSHWMNYGVVLVRDIAMMVDEHARKAMTEPREGTGNIYMEMKRCKRLARIIKAQRTPPWPCEPTPDLPPKEVADELVDCYLQTSETIYRILHVPSFRKEYESVWITDVEPDKNFLVQLKLVLAIGATSYNDKFTLRPSAIRWVYEATTWISDPSLKHRIGLQYLQTHALLMIAREMVAVGEDLVWLSTGNLLRVAMHMGLHRDPAQFPSRSTFANEMHRRLWCTILELCLQTCLTAGGPPLISLDDFDTQLPCNFEDEQLTNDNPVPKPESEYTHASVAIALGRTFPVRLAVAKFLNNFNSSGTYEETLRLDKEYRATYKDLRRTFQCWNARDGPSPSPFETRMADVIMNRYLSSLHLPFFPSALHNTAHAYSRKVVIDAALKTWYAVNQRSGPNAAAPSAAIAPTGKDSVERVVICGHGFFRMAAMQATLIVAVELRSQLQEDDGLGAVPLRQDLLSVADDSKDWAIWTMEAGETNIKGYVFICLIRAHIDSLMRNLAEKEIAESLVQAAQNAEKESMSILEAQLEQLSAEQTANEVNQMSLDVTPGMMEGWDFTAPNFSLDQTDPMSWYFDIEAQPTLLW